ncbi:hypothetical protein F5878DRAFT_535967 [Lentinula raphanica]|uniref:Uncharacterized protein n=1 Tax=Lentinula raphanica TaxID=153919 RepID=A0AA38PAT9_9AGAR|nr:hypothetical protein F5878DRAFT_535967 [Lentinula raphanica]
MTPSQSFGIVLIACVATWASLFRHPENLQTDSGKQPIDPANQRWNLNLPPSENATGHLIFQSVSSLLQHWPNARYRNGHTIVPGTIPIGTTLYHGRSDPNYPKGADWTATDPEHSFLFCKRPCWHLTLVTTRPLKILYFDGSSAVKMHGGSMDSQDILLWGERKAEMVFSEEERLDQLCKWGSEFGLDGFVRMEMNFEVMLCDFESGVETVSFLHLSNASPSDPKPPSASDDAESDAEMDVWTGGGLNPAVTIRNFELMHSSSQYNQYPGDTRIQLDFTSLVSFYDPDLAPSLIRIRNKLNVISDKGGTRWLYDLAQIDRKDVVTLHQKLREALHLQDDNHPTKVTSGVDWPTLIQVIIKRFGSRLESLRYVSTSHSGSTSILDDEDRVLKVFAQINVMLTPYIPYGLRVVEDENEKAAGASAGALAWAEPVYELCSTSHTSYIAKALLGSMTPSERLLLGAVRETTQEICRVLVKIWASGKEAGLDEKYWLRRTKAKGQANNHSVTERDQQDDKLKYVALAKRWTGEIERLMDWLDWHMWVRCSPACGDEELCYMPTWPFFGGPPPGPAAGPEPIEETSRDGVEWERPVPKCIRKIAPYSF